MEKSKKLIYGIGVNDADYKVKPIINGKRKVCPFYIKWTSMLCRCYSAKFQEKYTSYIGCIVDKEWLYFMNFKSWMENQDWKGKELDKDLLHPNNKVYSKNTCLFISKEINQLLTTNDKKRGKFPQGVTYNKESSNFKAYININCKKKHLGYFDNIGEAEQSYLKAKISYMEDIANTLTCDNQKQGLQKHIELYKTKLEGLI